MSAPVARELRAFALKLAGSLNRNSAHLPTDDRARFQAVASALLDVVGEMQDEAFEAVRGDQ